MGKDTIHLIPAERIIFGNSGNGALSLYEGMGNTISEG
jgi:hypothetical protein